MSDNPYAAPSADGDPGPATEELTKDQRVNLINRRTVSYIIEMAIIMPVMAIPAAFLGDWFSWVGGALYVLLRDVIGTAPFAKSVVGLETQAISGQLTTAAKVTRNVLLAVPFVPLIEYFAAFYGNNQMQRLGDKMADTRVVDLAPDTKGVGSWTGQLIGALIAYYLLAIMAAGAIILALR